MTVCKTVIHRFESGCRLQETMKRVVSKTLAYGPFFVFENRPFLRINLGGFYFFIYFH